jgi:peptidoglycan hydrolase-like protein with peptidoglycan-binding domain
VPIVTGVFIPVSSSGNKRRPAGANVGRQPPVAVIKQLHDELAAAGFPVDKKETGATPKFGPATGLQLKSFQERYKLEATATLTPTTGGVLSLVALVAEETDRVALRKKLAEAVNAVPDSPEYSYWLARYALLAGDPGLAARVKPVVFQGFRGNHLGNGIFTTDPGNAVPQQPDVAFPENFYSYRYSLMAQEDIDYLRTLEPPSTTTSSPRIALRPANGSPDTFDPPHQPVINAPPPAASSGATRRRRLIDSALMWLNAVEAWQLGNADLTRILTLRASAIGDPATHPVETISRLAFLRKCR